PEKGDGVAVTTCESEESASDEGSLEAAFEENESSAEDVTEEASLFEEEAEHPEDELGYEMADIDSDESENEGDANL
ncbi:MAG TPA: hypothetical protein PL182_07535, partial [Pseudobdellovibrionaceae bacterium]|nr:hypothetical protein [Pseudobdellovibrionaceae bacterium]